MITEKQFLDAVDIIKQYQKQIAEIVNNTAIKADTNRKTPVAEWINKHPTVASESNGKKMMHTRILRALEGNMGDEGINFIEDYTKHKFMRLRHVSLGSWQLFSTLTGITI